MMRRDSTDSPKSVQVVFNFDSIAFLSDNDVTKDQANYQRINKIKLSRLVEVHEMI